MTLLRSAFCSWVCACMLLSLACGSGGNPAHGGGSGAGGSRSGRDAGDDGNQHDAGGDVFNHGHDAGVNGDHPGGSGGSNGGSGTGGSSAQAGHGGSGAAGDASLSALHIDSFAPGGTEVGGVFRYRVVLDQTGPASYELTSAPDGASIDANGLVTWTPSFSQGGKLHPFSVKATLGNDEATQDFGVAVTALVISAEQLLDPDSDQLQVISVSSPLSEASGVTLTVPPGALSGAASISIATTSNAPLMPAQSSGGDVPLVLGFGPSGSVFNSPIDLIIPLSPASWQKLLAGQGVASAWTLGSDGVWQSLPIEYVDLENGYVQIKLQHFSLVGLMATPEVLKLEPVQLGESACPSGLFVKASFTQAVLSTGLDQWLNGEAYAKSGLAANSKLKDVLSMLPAGNSLQLRLRAVLTDTAGSSQERQYQVLSLLKRPNGHVDLSVNNDGGNVLYSQSDIAPDSSVIDQALNGEFTQFVFHDYPSMQDGQVTLDAFAYLRWPGAAPIAAGSEGQAFASLVQAFTYTGLSAGTSDADCDGTLDAADSTQTLALPPRIRSSSETTLRTTVNAPLSLFINVASEAAGGVTVSWAGGSPAAMISPSSDGMTASFVSAMPGSYKVVATANDTAGSTSQGFLVIVDSAVTPNTPPRCKINAKRTSVFTGEQIALEAVLEDAEQPNQELSVEWSVAAGATLSSSSERRVSFGSAAPAVYDVICVARDGLSPSQPTTLSISVLDRPQNSPPKLNFVAPASATLQLGSNGLASQQLRVSATDVDNDAVSIQFTLLGGDATLSIANSPASTPGVAYGARTFETSVPGPYAVLVRAVDQNNATSESVVIKLLVAQSLDGTDADRDGFPASVDCNDNNAKVYPGAPEICGDGIDQNCNGSDQSLADCDADRDGKTTNNGDCDDNDPNVFPGAFERCNGRDDNCNGTTDEGYVVGTACSLGVGACASTGTTVCSSSAGATVCTAKPTAPTPETCNGIDDNCNGTIDDVPAQGAADINNCGGCGTACSGNAHQVAACSPNAGGKLGCSYNCSPGYTDLDHDPQNGCEYSCAKPTKESCNGVDDDCDGRIDEQSDSQFYTGQAGTLGVGECRGGLMVCKQGALVQALAQVTPSKELCDQRDNNCNGKVDEGFNLGGACDGPDSDLCANGRFVCSGEGTVVCGLEAQQNLKDVCDGVDNDCNPDTPDGAADPALAKRCDEGNPAFCEPGRPQCTNGRVLCSNEMRDATSCKVCECDTTPICDTNGTGYICPCDPQCTGPDIECPCDVSSVCDLVDGAEECGCDKKCVGETTCSCDLIANKCDTIAKGFICSCDHACGPTCACDAVAGVCDKTVKGDNCFCDEDCYQGCPCDDHNSDTCAKDSSGNACQCDPGCQPTSGSCTCDLTPKSCDRDTKTGTVCQCDADCGTASCNCNTSSACDKAKSGDVCFCDVDCSPKCPCDDMDPMVCARDSNGNACLCDPTCNGGDQMCECDAASGSCDKDKSGNPCSCDKDCQITTCDCDKSSGACDKDAMGNTCACDRDCGTNQCTCDTTKDMCDKDANGKDCLCDANCRATSCTCDLTKGTCDKDAKGQICPCDLDCPVPTCDCNVTMGACDPNCACDKECQPTSCTCDLTRATCDKDAKGAVCPCDKDCPVPTCDCNVTKGACDANCPCDAECQPSGCTCDLTQGTCDKDAKGQICPCDLDCPVPTCDCNVTMGACDANCACDKECQANTCTCNTTPGICDNTSAGQVCACDNDCAVNSCACDLDAEKCDQNSAGDDCLCDSRCYPICPCADADPNSCHQDSDGHACSCDGGCEKALTPGCACDKARNTCDQDAATGAPCACDVDCGAAPPPCTCDTTQACDTTSGGDACLCDKQCYPACPCDDANPMTCAHDSAGNACRCDPTCNGGPTTSCGCDANKGMCDKDASGNPCACDVDCNQNTCKCNVTPATCDKDAAGNQCACDVDCPQNTCMCNVTQGTCDKDASGNQCACDVDCNQNTCMCNVTQGTCDKDAKGAQCPCDIDCNQNTCMCNVTAAKCDKDASGNQCPCDVDCPQNTCTCNATPGACDKDAKGNQCACDVDCNQNTCTCNVTQNVCDKDAKGAQCPCDGDCAQNTCMCNATPNVCDKDANGNQCPCDVDCAQNTCMCNVTQGVCDKDANANQCPCDGDCAQNTCMCNVTPNVCDKVNGESCACDVDCSTSSCMCDVTPNVCDKDQGGQSCPCDPSCVKP